MFQETVPAGVGLCGGDEMAHSFAASIDALTGGDESAAVLNREIGELMLRPLYGSSSTQATEPPPAMALALLQMAYCGRSHAALLYNIFYCWSC